jgi:5'-nucleotidase (lipoprotein e(P4) family)
MIRAGKIMEMSIFLPGAEKRITLRLVLIEKNKQMNIQTSYKTRSGVAGSSLKHSFLGKIILIFFLVGANNYSHAQDSAGIAAAELYTQGDLKIYPVLWQQKAAEYRALCYQAFNIAEYRLDEILKQNSDNKNLAIITDLDETILDNSDIAAKKIKEGKDVGYAEWKQWVDQPVVPTVPGAVDFLQWVGQQGITVFYISNRRVTGLQLTLGLLQRLKLPNADTSHMLFLSDDDYSKESRRQTVMKNYNVLLLLGDNLDDFMQVFEEKPINERFRETDKEKDEWGKKFIVLPNATYGEWENALYDYKDDLSPEQKSKVLKALLKGFDEPKQ